ncbi:hypothetical protein Pint_11846 [Pistacia integerrima]|uniref:Uncharacterized protein n=1 Tax=Pistacia integerrima TaxID=434235 RepID=A0ACC0XJT5_9ROSI|nr:hypothetical protein Pint_11846 [Pistacia integerrima]
MKLRRTVSIIKDAILDAETQLEQNKLADSSEMLNAAADMLHKLASDRSQVCTFILSFIYYLKIKGIRKRLDGMAATIMRDRDLMRDYDQDAPDIKCVNPRGWVAQYLSFYGIEDDHREFPYIAPDLLAIIMKSSPFQPVTQSFVNRWTSNCRPIRLLCLSGSQFEVLPDSVGSLEQLRYLDLSWNLIMVELSEAICKLKGLQTLILLGCSRLKKFPENMRKLINLRYLEITTNGILPGNELKYLHSLRYLHLYSCHHLVDLSGKMQGLINLRTFILQGCDNVFFLPDDITYLERLEKLVIHSCSNLNQTMDLQEEDRRLNLKVFMIYELHQTMDLPQLILQKSANTLEYMRIDSCSSLTTLPPWLTDLKSLQKLEIVSCSELSSLPCGMEKLTTLEELEIQKSPTLSESCRRNWSNIDHVQNIHLDPAVASSSRSGKINLFLILDPAVPSPSGDNE